MIGRCLSWPLEEMELEIAEADPAHREAAVRGRYLVEPEQVLIEPH